MLGCICLGFDTDGVVLLESGVAPAATSERLEQFVHWLST